MLGVLTGLLSLLRTVRILNSKRELGVKPRDKVQLPLDHLLADLTLGQG